eukprot:1099856-Amphidinium_carterae.2
MGLKFADVPNGLAAISKVCLVLQSQWWHVWRSGVEIASLGGQTCQVLSCVDRFQQQGGPRSQHTWALLMCSVVSRTGVHLVATRVDTFCQSLLQDYKTGTPGDYGWKLLTSSDPAEKQATQTSDSRSIFTHGSNA